MNLYRSFGNLMEAWVMEGGRCLDSELLGNNDEDSAPPSSDVGTNLRSESVDSGVETASSDASFAATSCSVSTDNAEMDTFTPVREASASQSPAFSSPVPSSASSSSPCVCPSSTLRQKVEQALQRANSSLSAEEVLRRRPGASFLTKWPSSELTRGQRSLRRDGPSGSVRQTSKMCRRPMSLSFDSRGSAHTGSQDLGMWEGAGLSPGLTYLEQVCQMLEEVARQQMHGRVLQLEVDALQECQDVETSQSDSAAAEDDSSSPPQSEQSPHEPQQRKYYPHTRFRQRSASEITSTALHLRRLNTDCRGQHLSTDDLLETADEKQESKKEETNKTDRSWRFKFGSLRREGQQTQPPEKGWAQRRLSQLFRRTRRTVPI